MPWSRGYRVHGTLTRHASELLRVNAVLVVQGIGGQLILCREDEPPQMLGWTERQAKEGLWRLAEGLASATQPFDGIRLEIEAKADTITVRATHLESGRSYTVHGHAESDDRTVLEALAVQAVLQPGGTASATAPAE